MIPHKSNRLQLSTPARLTALVFSSKLKAPVNKINIVETEKKVTQLINISKKEKGDVRKIKDRKGC